MLCTVIRKLFTGVVGGSGGGREVKSVPSLHKEKGWASGLKITVLLRFRVDGDLPNRKPPKISHKRMQGS